LQAKPTQGQNLKPSLRKKHSDSQTNFEFGLTARNQIIINSLNDHPFKALLTNLTEINVGYSIKKLNKEEIIQFIDNFFNKIGIFFI